MRYVRGLQRTATNRCRWSGVWAAARPLLGARRPRTLHDLTPLPPLTLKPFSTFLPINAENIFRHYSEPHLGVCVDAPLVRPAGAAEAIQPDAKDWSAEDDGNQPRLPLPLHSLQAAP